MPVDIYVIAAAALSMAGWMGFIICDAANRKLRKREETYIDNIRRLAGHTGSLDLELDNAEETIEELKAHIAALQGDLQESEEARIKADSERERVQRLLDSYCEHIRALEKRLADWENSAAQGIING